MIKNIAVSTIIVTLIQHINFVCGNVHQSSEVAHTTTSINTRTATAIMPSETASTSQYKPTSFTLQSTTFFPSPTRRKTVTFSIASPTQTSFFTAANPSLYLSRSSEIFSAFPNNSLNSVDFSSYATSILSSATSAFSSSTSVLTLQSSKTSVPPTSRSIHSPASTFSSSTLHLTGTFVKYSTSPKISTSSTGISISFKWKVSTTAISLSTFKKSSSTFVRSTSLSSSPFYSSSITTSHLSSSLLSSTMNFTSLPTSSSTIIDPTTKTSLSSTTDYSTLSHSHTEPLSQTVSSNPSLLMPSSRDTTSLKSTKITTVGLSPLGTLILPSMKSSELKKTPSSTTKTTTSSSSSKVLEKILEFDGKLVVTPLSNDYNNNLKKLAHSIELILDEALKAVNGYSYSKVLLITPQENQSKFDCTFKLFIRQPSSETASTLLERIKKYNKTKGFGQFTLHSVETSVPCSNKLYTGDRLYLWAIIVIATLGVLCLVFFVAFVYTRRKLKKSTKRSLANEDNNSNLRYNDFFPPVFDGNDVSQNIPLKLTSVSSTESKQPLKFSDAVDTDSDPDEETGNKSEVASTGENGIKGDKLSLQEPPQSTYVTLHVQDDNDEDETKFSTFSRKR